MSNIPFRFLLPAILSVTTGSAAAQFVEPVDLIYRWSGEATGDLFGWINRVVGDVDGDGVPDLGIGVPLNTEGGTNAGKAYLRSGRTGALIRTHVGQPNDYMGHDINGVGDLNGDGKMEYIVGAPASYFYGAQVGAGRVLLFDGDTGTQLHQWTGQAFGDAFGGGCGGAGNVLSNGVGDINNDGTPDIIINAPSAGPNGGNSGRVDVYSGANPGQLIYRINGQQAGERVGSASGGLGDVNGDGFGDFVIGASGAGASFRGRAYVHSGRTGNRILTLQPRSSGGGFGFLFATGAGDVNNDGTPDIYVGDLGDSSQGAGTGAAYVFSGADGSELHYWPGQGPNDGMGVGRGCGDVNGDGYADVIASEFQSQQLFAFGGRSFVFSGKDGSVLRTITSSQVGQSLGYSTVGAGDVNGDGNPDFMISAVGFSGGRGRVYVIAGESYAQPATLTDVTRTLGIHLSGGIPELQASDDTYYVLQSGPGFNPAEPHPARADFGFDTGGSAPVTLDIRLEEKGNIGGGSVVVLLRNWNSGQWDEIARHVLNPSDQVYEMRGIPATEYINGANRTEVRVRTFAILILNPAIRGIFSHDFVGVDMNG